MAHKFKKGDRVRILDGSAIRDYTFGWGPAMKNYVGCEMTIKTFISHVNGPAYYLDDVPYKWDERGLVLVDSEDGGIKDVIFNNPATIVLWKDGTKTVVKCQEGDTYSKELGLAMCISKKYLGNKGNFNEVFKKWIPDETPYTEEELSQLLQNIDFSKIGEALGDILYNFGKSLIEIYGPTPEPTAENQEPEEDLDIEPIEPEPEDITNEDLTEALYSHCVTTPCKDCKIPKDEKGNCERIESMGREELINTYKAIKK